MDPVYLLQRIGDEHLMPKIIASKQFSNKEICKINYCRVYLDVTTISDPMLADAKTLNKYMYSGTRFILSSSAKHISINQQKPGKVSWWLWRKAMKVWVDNLTLKLPWGSGTTTVMN
eukprot:9555091-Ditylum_brightwellii.AAC.2